MSVNLSQNTTIYTAKALLWKLNNSGEAREIKYEKVKQEINELIQVYWKRAESEKAYGWNWELLKYELGKFGSDIAKQNRLIEDGILSQLSALSFKEPLTHT